MSLGTAETPRLNAQVAWPSRVFFPTVIIVISLLVLVWLFIPWAWSPVDDPGQVIAMNREIAESGRLGGTFQRFIQLYQGDQEGGVFRPAAWLYPPLVYQLPVSLAHLVRLLMVIAAVLGPVMYFRRSGASSARLWLTLFLVIAGASTLYQGLFLLSIQELGGAAFVGLGLMAYRTSPRLTLWVVAALFKAPFAWLLVGNAVYLWRNKQKRVEASISGGLGVVILAISAIWSRSGGYSSTYNLNPLDPALWENFSRLVEPMNALLLVSVIWWLITTNGSVRRNPGWLLFLIAWAGYTLQMIPWGVTAYYMGPISYLFSIFLASVLVDVKEMNRSQALIALLMPAFVAIWLTRITLSLGFEINSVMMESKDCLAPLAGTSTIMNGQLLYVTSSPEGPIRVKDSLIVDDPNWNGEVNLEDGSFSGFSRPETTHYLTIGSAEVPEGRTVTEVCSGSSITLLKLAPSG